MATASLLLISVLRLPEGQTLCVLSLTERKKLEYNLIPLPTPEISNTSFVVTSFRKSPRHTLILRQCLLDLFSRVTAGAPASTVRGPGSAACAPASRCALLYHCAWSRLSACFCETVRSPISVRAHASWCTVLSHSVRCCIMVRGPVSMCASASWCMAPSHSTGSCVTVQGPISWCALLYHGACSCIMACGPISQYSLHLVPCPVTFLSPQDDSKLCELDLVLFAGVSSTSRAVLALRAHSLLTRYLLHV